MENMERQCAYFKRGGMEHTERVVEAVGTRLEEGNIDTVVVASTTGETALRFSEDLGGGTTIISVAEAPLMKDMGYNYPRVQPEMKKRLEEKGVIVVEHIPFVFHSYFVLSITDPGQRYAHTPEAIMRDTFYAFGQGFKVAVEVVLMAVVGGFRAPYKNVIGVGGSSRGADTAVVLNSTYPNDVFSSDGKKRLKIREIICKPW